MKILMLYGLNCNQNIWNGILPHIKQDVTIAAYPREITLAAETVTDISKWIDQVYHNENYDVLIGHSMGGIIALELVSCFHFPCKKVIFIESNLRPAGNFYRNLMTASHMEQYGGEVRSMLRRESTAYRTELVGSLQEQFDYTDYVRNCPALVYGVYGDRGAKDYPGRYEDLCLTEDVLKRIHFYFCENSCHLPMIENPAGLSDILNEIIEK